MIDYKKANSYFVKRLKSDRVMAWSDSAGGVWLTDCYIAIYYPDNQIRPLDPSQLKKQAGIKNILQEVSESTLYPAKLTNLIYTTDKFQYCVFRNKGMLNKQFVDILNSNELFYDGKRMFIANDDNGDPIGIACSFITADDILAVFDAKEGGGK